MSALSFVIDVETGDLVDSAEGFFEEDETAAAAVYCQTEFHLNAWPGDPDAGSDIQKLMSEQGDDPVGIEAIENETARALEVLADEGLIDSVGVAAARTQSGRAAVQTSYRDLASGEIIDELIKPFGG